MNLIEARKQAHEGWARSPSRTEGRWVDITTSIFNERDLDAEDWEPKPAPAKPFEPFETEVWVHKDGGVARVTPETEMCAWEENGWRKIRVREVSSPEESSPSPPKVRVEIREATVGSSGSEFRCRKCGSISFTEQGATTCCWNHP